MNQTPTATVDVTSITRIDHDEAMRITAVENRKLTESMGSLSPTQWSTPTECTLWDVRAMSGPPRRLRCKPGIAARIPVRSVAASRSARSSVRRSGGME